MMLDDANFLYHNDVFNNAHLLIVVIYYFHRQPFDIVLRMQNIEQIIANSVVNIEIKPEIRGEIDCIKLSRLLKAIDQISIMCSKLPTPPVQNVVQELFDGVVHEIIMTSNSNKPVPNLHNPRAQQISSSSPPPQLSSSSTSTTSSPIPPSTPMHTFSSPRIDQQAQEHIDPTVTTLRVDLLIPMIALDLTYNVEKGHHIVLEIDSLYSTLSARCYDRSMGFDLKSISMKDSFRHDGQKYLMRTPQECCDKLVHISHVSVKDRRSPLYVEHATYIIAEFAFLNLSMDVNTINHLQPFFDVLLKSSSDDISSRSSGSNSNNTTATSGNYNSINSSASSDDNQSHSGKNENIIHAVPSFDESMENNMIPKGMHLVATMERLSLELLRAPHFSHEKHGGYLDRAYSSQISGMKFEFFTLHLMRSYVKLKSFEVFDIRNATQDYAFHRVFFSQNYDDDNVDDNINDNHGDGGVTHHRVSYSNDKLLCGSSNKSNDAIKVKTDEEEMLLKESADSDNSVADQLNDDEIFYDAVENFTSIPSRNNSSTDINRTIGSTSSSINSRSGSSSSNNSNNLLTVSFIQESKSNSLMEVNLSDITCFIAMDTILDFSDIFMSNLFALLALFSASKKKKKMTIMSNNDKESLSSIDDSLKSSEYLTTVEDQTIDFLVHKDDDDDVEDDEDPSFVEDGDFSLTVEEEVVVSTMNVTVKIINPKLIFLEDPTTLESQAVGGTCGIGLQFSRVSKSMYTLNDNANKPLKTSLVESMHITISKYEVFVIQNMSKWIPQPILDPMEVELHMKRVIIDGVMKKLTLHIEADNIDAQVSFNDILLAQSIISRRLLTESNASNRSSDINNKATSNTATTNSATSSTSNPSVEVLIDSNQKKNKKLINDSVITFKCGVNSLTAIIINDFNRKNTPVLKYNLKNFSFEIEEHTARSDIMGTGTLSTQIDFFNPYLSTWEPFLEVWQPSTKLYSIPESNSKICEVRSDCTLQITVSGTMLEVFLRSFSVLFHGDHDEQFAHSGDDDYDYGASRSIERSTMSDIEIHNLLGEGVDIELFNCANKSKLISLHGGQSGTINSSSSKSVVGSRKMNSMDLPNSVDLHFMGPLKQERMPLFHLPMNANKPRAYNLQPTTNDDEDDDDGDDENEDNKQLSSAIASLALPLSSSNSHNVSGKSSTTTSPVIHEHSEFRRSNKVHVIEPIVEEVFENSRYDPLTGWWRRPFFMGDPYEWTDASGTIRRDIGLIEIDAVDKWEWQGKWEVDMDGILGTEIDKEGWEYATSFNMFTIVSARRTSQAMDVVRRRRWTRTRVPKASSISQRERPLTLYWDVQILSNGSRKIDIRSALQISNQLSFPVIISLQHNAWDEEVIYGPIDTGIVFRYNLHIFI